MSDSEGSLLLDASQYDLRYSPAMSRRRLGSFNSNGDALLLRDECASPDITPNGSLRRRRSRVLSEEDEGNLMDFLRSSGHESSNRERKSAAYGSLDRSWARRARSGSGSKKRPDLLNVQFGADRERPSSPSPLAESKPLAVEEHKPRYAHHQSLYVPCPVVLCFCAYPPAPSRANSFIHLVLTHELTERTRMFLSRVIMSYAHTHYAFTRTR